MNPTEQNARRALQNLIQKYRDMSPDDRLQMNEASVVRQFIDILLRDVLLWPIEDTARYKYEVHTTVGRPDITLIPDSGGVVFVEAKKFGVIKDLEERKKSTETVFKGAQLALTGMATDRTREEQQAINYAFANNGDWAILTNFEKLRLFNARRDWLVISFETPEAYLQHFDDLWTLAYPNILQGSLDVLSSQRLRPEVDAQYLDFINEWRQKLAQDILANARDNQWAFKPDGQVDLPALRAVVQRYIDRLVMIRFAEDHRVTQQSGTLYTSLEYVRQMPGALPLHQHLQGYVRYFDREHNSALFAEGVADKVVLSQAVLTALIEKLYEARYRAMPADIMGNTYEQYLGKTLVQHNGGVRTADNLETRKKQGSYYTPQVIVQYIVDSTLGRYLYGTVNGKPDGAPLAGESRKTSQDITDLRVLDSACGSGGFLIYAYQVLAKFYEAEYGRWHTAANDRINALMAQGISDEIELRIQTAALTSERDRLRDFPRIILETHLYGVDLDPQAAEIAVVNLMMRAMENRPAEKLLPLILNQNIKVGNSLIGFAAALPTKPPTKTRESFDPTSPAGSLATALQETLADHEKQQARHAEYPQLLAELRQLRQAVISTHHNTPEHTQAIQDLQAATGVVKAELNQHFAGFTDLAAINPFHWAVEFPEVFVDAHGQPLANPGFTIILGNPPWEILKPDLREFYAQFDENIESRYSREKADKRIAELIAEDPTREVLHKAQTQRISESAAYFRYSGDYRRQGRGDTATQKLFMERSYGLLNDGGRLGYVVPSGIYTDLGTKELREMMLNDGRIEYIFSFSNERFFFPGVDHRFKFAMLGVQKGTQSDGFWAAFRFNPRVAVAPDELAGFLTDESNLVYIKRESIARFSPDSLSVMEFETPKTYHIVEKIYADWPLLGADIPNKWRIKLNRQFDMANDRHLLNSSGDGVPYYEGSMIHQYDAFYDAPQYWISEEKIQEQPDTVQKEIKSYRVVHRRIASATNERTLISAIVPKNTASDTNATQALIAGAEDDQIKLYVCAMFNSLVLDYVLRFKVTSTLNMFHMEQLPLPRLQKSDPLFDAIVIRAARLTCTRSEFAGLWEAAVGTAWESAKGATASDERQKLRDELDALVARLYGLTRDEFAHILGTFPLVFPAGELGENKKATLLGVFDNMA